MSEHQTFFVGTYTEPITFGTGEVFESKGRGIYRGTFNPESGEAALLGVTEVHNPSYFAFGPSRNVLYAVNETDTYGGTTSGAVSAFAVDQDATLTSLNQLNQRPSYGADPCYLSVDSAGAFVFVANYSSGSVSVFPVQKDGSLGEVSDTVQHSGSSRGPHPVRQDGPHAHAATLDLSGKFVYVPDLGLDRVMVYELSAQGTLKPAQHPFTEVKPGAGPRQIVFSANGYAYLLNELNATVSVYRHDKNSGALQEVQTLSTLPEDFEGDNICAEVQLSPSGKFLYSSNRGHDSIAIFKVSEAGGQLTLVGHQSTGGKTPRHFTISPGGDYMLVANQDSDNLVVFRRNEGSGKLEATGQVVEIPSPVCVLFH